MIVKENLETVDPKGRLDVLAFNGARLLTEHIENQYQVKGIWDQLKPHINDALVQGLKGIKLPVEAKVILGIVQANWNQEKRGIE